MSQIFQAATWLLCIAFLSGLFLAGIRFATDRPSPPWVAKIHGFSVVGAISLLIFAWVKFTLPSIGVYGVLILFVAAIGGLVLNLRYHWNQKPLPEWLVFVHMTLGFMGLILIALLTLGSSTL